MPGKSTHPQEPPSSPAELRGVIDQIEGDLLVVVFDDEQRLDWPRRFAPADARSGDAVIVRVAPAGQLGWPGQGEPAGKIRLSQQTIQLPGEVEVGPLTLSIAVDAADTAARQARIRGLLDDIFKKKQEP